MSEFEQGRIELDEPPKRGRGRPRKYPVEGEEANGATEETKKPEKDAVYEVNYHCVNGNCDWFYRQRFHEGEMIFIHTRCVCPRCKQPMQKGYDHWF